jgi:micrococcal nuclease
MRPTWKSYVAPFFIIFCFGVYETLFHFQQVVDAATWPYKQYQVDQLAARIKGTVDARGFEQAVVRRAIDGDTVELSDGRVIRYIGMDTPELHHPLKGEECYGQEAYEFNRLMVEGKVIQLEKDQEPTDKYGRTLRYIWRGNILVDKVLVEKGLAFPRPFPPNTAHKSEFDAAEIIAQGARLGLWSKCQIQDEHTQQIHPPPQQRKK